MKFLMIPRSSKDEPTGGHADITEQAFTALMNYNEEMTKAGVLVSSERLQPSSKSKRLTFTNHKLSVMDGPFSETKEAVGGYLVLQADSLDEAVEIARSMPTLRYGISVEVRPILAECPIFQRHPDLVRRATDRPAEQLRVAAAA